MHAKEIEARGNEDFIRREEIIQSLMNQVDEQLLEVGKVFPVPQGKTWAITTGNTLILTDEDPLVPVKN